MCQHQVYENLSWVEAMGVCTGSPEAADSDAGASGSRPEAAGLWGAVQVDVIDLAINRLTFTSSRSVNDQSECHANVIEMLGRARVRPCQHLSSQDWLER